MPAQTRRGETTLVQPVGHRGLVEDGHIRIIRSKRGRNGKRPPPFPVAPSHPAIYLLVKQFELGLILLACPGMEVQPLIPASTIEDALLRVAAKELLADNRPPFFVAAFQHAHFI